jgi:hypothetical protein
MGREHEVTSGRMPGSARVARLVLALLVAAIPSLGHGQAPPTVKPCKVDAPDTWRSYSVQWEGPCEAGNANGVGALRAYENHKVVEAFYGRVKEGSLSFGVLETADGYMAGRFVSGRLVKDDDRNTVIKAFREGASGALAASESFKKKGNPSSAKFYQEVADRLSSQMD